MNTTGNDQHTLCIGTMIEKLEIIQILSSSARSQVSLAKDVCTMQHYVIKSLSNRNVTPRQFLLQKNEIVLHSHLSGHPNIIGFEKSIQTSDWTHIVIEYGYEGDLFTAISEKEYYGENHSSTRNIFLQLIETVKFLHSNGVYHRDLKPDNILVFDQGHIVKIADFGLATTDFYSKDYGCGSKFYFSPECHGDFLMDSQRGYATAPNDVWSLGIILINLVTGRNPWHTASLDDVTYSAFLRDPDLLLKMFPISIELNTILKRIFCLDPLKRCTLEELHFRVKNCARFTAQSDTIQNDLPTPPDTPNLLLVSSCQEPLSTDLLPQDALFPKLADGN